jgi:hypothetical protein
VPCQVEVTILTLFSYSTIVDWKKPTLIAVVFHIVIIWLQTLSGRDDISIVSKEEGFLLIDDHELCIYYEELAQ